MAASVSAALAEVNLLVEKLSLTSLAWSLTLIIVTCYSLAKIVFPKKGRDSKPKAEFQKKGSPLHNDAAVLKGEVKTNLRNRLSVPEKESKAQGLQIDSTRSGKSGEEENADGEYDAIIAGAGIAGSALAYSLGKAGRKVLLIERSLEEPDRIVGELLQPGGYLKLVELGMEDCLEGIDAQLVYGYALFKDGKDAKVAYPIDPTKYGDLLVAGRSFHNGRFIVKLREKAAAHPMVTLRQGTVVSLLEDESGMVTGVRYRVGEEEKEVRAPLTFACDGCFSRLRKGLSAGPVENPSNFVGLVLENCELPYPNFGHVVLADPSPILFYPISSTEVRCLVDIPGDKVPSIASGAMAEHLRGKVAPQLPLKLQVPFLAAVEKGNIRMHPNRVLPANPVPRAGALLMGDAFNMRHPLTGGGMTVALSDVAVLTETLQPLADFKDPVNVSYYTEAFFTRRKPVASTINTLAGALYKVFCASKDEALKEMRQACFDYLALGGVFSNGPVALLSGLNPRPLSLVLHFFAVAFFGVGRLLLPFPSPRKLWIGIRLIQGAASIIFPIIAAEGVRQMFFPNTIPAYYRAPLCIA